MVTRHRAALLWALFCLSLCAQAAAQTPSVKINRDGSGTSVAEGTTIRFKVETPSAVAADLEVTVSVADAMGSNFLSSASEGSKTVTISSGATSTTLSVATVGDSSHEPNGQVTATVVAGTGYTVGSPSSASWTILDNDLGLDSVALTGAPPTNQGGAYKVNDTVIAQATFEAAIDVVGSPVLILELAEGVHRSMTFDSAGGQTNKTKLSFFYIVQSGDVSTAGIAFPANAFSNGPGGTIRATGTMMQAGLVVAATAASTSHKVDGVLPTFSSARLATTTLIVVFDQPLRGVQLQPPGSAVVLTETKAGAARTITGTGLTVSGSTARVALPSRVSPDATLTVAYTKPATNGLADAAGNPAASFTGKSVTNNSSHTTPRITSGTGATKTFMIVENHANQASVGTLTASDQDLDALTWSLASGVGHEDSATFRIGSSTGEITVAPGTTLDHEAKARYVFMAQVTDGDDASGNRETMATTDDTILVTVNVNNVDEPPGTPAAPTVNSRDALTELDVSWTAPSDTGASAISAYRLRYFAGAADPSNASEWEHQAHNSTNATTTITALVPNTAYRVQVAARSDGWSAWSPSGSGSTAAPAVTGVAFAGTPPTGQNDTYKLADTVTARVRFSHNVDIVGNPVLKLLLATGVEKDMTFDGSQGRSATSTLEFIYTVAATDESTAGAGFAVNALSVGDMVTIKAAGTEGDAVLAHAAVAADSSRKVDGVVPTFSTGSVNQKALVVVFSEPMSESGMKPASSVFTVSETRSGVTTTISGTSTVNTIVAGSNVTAELVSAVPADATTTVAYTQDSSKLLTDLAGNAAANFTGKTVTNSPHTSPTFTAGATATFSIPESSAAQASVGTVAATDADGDTLTWSLASGGDNASFTIVSTTGEIKVAAGTTLDFDTKPQYTITARVTDGEDDDGNPDTDIDDTIVVTVDLLQQPEVSGVAFQGAGPSSQNDTYKLGDTVRARVNFDAPVDIVDNPVLKLLLAAGVERDMTLASGGRTATSTVIFTYEVAAGDESTAGAGFGVNALSLDGATIRATDRTDDADLTHSAVPASSNHKVDGVVPTFMSGTVSTGTLMVVFSEPMNEAGTKPLNSAFTVTATSAGVPTTINGSSNSSVFVSGKVATVNLESGVALDATVTVAYTKPSSNPLTDLAGNAVETFAGKPVANSADTSPTFDDGDETTFSIPESSVAQASVGTVAATDADADELTYSLAPGGDNAAFTIVVDTGEIKLAAGTTLNFDTKPQYTITARVTDGEDDDGDPEPSPTFDDTIEVTVNVTRQPTVRSVAFVGAPLSGQNGRYKLNGTVRARVTFSQAVDVVSNPVLKLRLAAGAERDMTFDASRGRTNTTTLDFTYGVVAGDMSRAGAGFGANKLSVGVGVTIRAAGGSKDAALAHAAVPASSSHRVDGVLPTFMSATVSSSTLLVVYSEPMNDWKEREEVGEDRTSLPFSSAFTVTATSGGVPTTINGQSSRVSVSGTVVSVKLESRVAAGSTVRVDYAKPTENPLVDLAGNEAAGFMGQPATAPAHSSPFFDLGAAATFSIPENRAAQASVGTVSATDADGDTLTWSLASDGDNASFTIVSDTGEIKLAAGTTLDFDTKPQYTFTAQVTDGEDSSGMSEGGSPTIDASIVVTVDVTESEGSPTPPPGGGGGPPPPSGEPSPGDDQKVDGREVTLTFDRALDPTSVPAPSDFTVTVTVASSSAGSASTGPATVGAAQTEDYRVTAVSIRGSTLRLTISPPVPAGASVNVSYTKGARPLRISDGAPTPSFNDVPDFALDLNNETPDAEPPTVSGVAFVGAPASGQNDTYKLGDTVTARVTFDAAVDVTGSPVLKLLLAADAERDMAFDTSGTSTNTTTLDFAYEVAAGDVSTAGAGFGADRLSVGAGVTIRATGASTDAALAHSAVPASVSHKVDGVLPTFSSGSVSASTLVVVFEEPMNDGGATVPASSVFTVTATRGGASTTINGSASLNVSISGAVVTAKLESEVDPGATVTVAYAKPTSNPLADAAGNEAEAFAGKPVANTAPKSPPAPDVPEVAGSSPTGITVTWTAPDVTGRPPITGYDVRYRASGATDWTDHEHTGTLAGTTIEGLSAGTTYEVQVRALNADGAGPWSATGSGSTQTAGSAPIADAGEDLEVDPGEGVELDGSGSSDPDGDPLSFQWTQTDGEAVTLEGADTERPSFIAPQVAGALTFSLVVNDGNANSEPDAVTVSVRALAPVADAGEDLEVDPGERVELDGSGSSDPDGDPLSFQWTQTGGEAVTLEGADTERPSFIAPQVAGALTFSLVVNDGNANSEPDAVTVSVRNLAPVADAGEDLEVDPGEGVELDGSGSSDPNGDPLSYQWTQTGGEAVTLEGADTERPSFIAPQVAGALTFSLVVNDGNANSEPDAVTVSVRNLAPIADAGEDLEVDPGEGVELDGSGSSDPDGDPLSYQWTQTGGEAVTLEGADTERPSFIAPQVAGALTFSLVVNDGNANSEPDAVTVSVRDLAPSFGDAVVGTKRFRVDQAIERLVLPEAGGGNGALTYTLEPLPAGLRFDDSSRSLSGTPTAAGRFRLTYTATDMDGDAASLEFTVRVFDNRPPTADAGEDLEVDPGERVELDGSGSSDPDGDELSYAWLQTDGETITLEQPLSARPAFAAPQQPGTLTFALTVKDGALTSEPNAVAVRVRDLAPSFGGATVEALTLAQGRAIDPVVMPEATGGNGALTYSLTSLPMGLAGLEFEAATRTLSGTPTATGAYTFIYRVEDADAHRGDGDAALMIFRVTSSPPTAERRAVLEQTLAAVGRTALTSAVDAIGSRFASAGSPRSSITVAGQQLAGGGPGIAGRESGGFGGHGGSGGLGGFGHGFENGLGQGSGPGFGQDLGGSGSPRLRTDAGSLLLGSSFEWSFGGGVAEEPGEGGEEAGSRLWSIWGRGDLNSFNGRPERESRFDGDLRTGYLGVDVQSGKWLAGLAMSRGSSESDYSFGGGDADFERGRLDTSLTTVHPYARWKLSGSDEVWTLLGLGWGEATHVTGDASDRPERSDLSMWMAAGGLRKGLAVFRGVDLALRADAGLARLETDGGSRAVDGLSAGSWRTRAGVEASRSWQIAEGGVLTPFVELAGRYDGGDGAAGMGIEVAGGARYGNARFQIEARGRMLALHDDSGYEESGVSVSARMAPKENGEGLSMELGPRWGAAVGGAETLWQEQLPQHRGGALAAAGDGVDATLGYGFLVPGVRGVLTPFAEAAFAGQGRRYRLGTRFLIAPLQLQLELAGEHAEMAASETALEGRRVVFNLRFRF